MLGGLAIELVTLSGHQRVEAPEETGQTFEENARAKALYYAAATGQLTVAEDSGFEIDALGGAPGVFSARYGGVDATYPARFALIYEALRAKDARDSPARYVCALALARRDRLLFEARGVVEGRVAPEPRGEGGFGYDPIFYYPPFGRTFAEASDRKPEVSHRAQAFRALRAFLVKSGVLDQETRPTS
jgi:XTP/dITP diphosphohydrolase